MPKEVPKELIGEIRRRKKPPAKKAKKPPAAEPRPVDLDEDALNRVVNERVGRLFQALPESEALSEKEGFYTVDEDKFLEEEREAKKGAYPLDEVIEIREALHGSRRDVEEAIPKINELIRKVRDSPERFAEAVALLGKAKRRLGDKEGALRHYGIAYGRDPENSEIAHDYAMLLLEANRYGEAIEPLERYAKKAIDGHERREVQALLAAIKKIAA